MRFQTYFHVHFLLCFKTLHFKVHIHLAYCFHVPFDSVISDGKAFMCFPSRLMSSNSSEVYRCIPKIN